MILRYNLLFLLLPAMALGQSSQLFPDSLTVTSTNAAGQRSFGVINQGLGMGGVFRLTNTSNASTALLTESKGTGYAFRALQSLTGKVAEFSILTTYNTSTVLEASTFGTGNVGDFRINHLTSNANAVFAQTMGTGNAVRGINVGNGTAGAGYFKNDNILNTGAAVEGANNGLGVGVFGYNTGTGKAGFFRINNAVNSESTLEATTDGGGKAGYFTITNAVNVESVLEATTNGRGRAGYFTITNAANNKAALEATTNGVGRAATFGNTHPTTTATTLYAKHSGRGTVGLFEADNILNPAPALKVLNNGNGNTGEFITGYINNPQSLLYGNNEGMGIGLELTMGNSSNVKEVINAVTKGAGNVMLLNQQGTGNNIAVFQTSGGNQARIDRTGKGFFNGGTQNSGADLAEAFEVEGVTNAYETGDVLVISIRSDRKVEKSSRAYSALVAGVYATKPGVLLTEENMDADLTSFVPMGVVGVIPTKVCDEGGAIRRGDLLVTSSQAGYAMKADPGKLGHGQVLGKALEDFEKGVGKIKVLVSVR